MFPSLGASHHSRSALYNLKESLFVENASKMKVGSTRRLINHYNNPGGTFSLFFLNMSPRSARREGELLSMHAHATFPHDGIAESLRYAKVILQCQSQDQEELVFVQQCWSFLERIRVVHVFRY